MIYKVAIRLDLNMFSEAMVDVLSLFFELLDPILIIFAPQTTEIALF